MPEPRSISSLIQLVSELQTSVDRLLRAASATGGRIYDSTSEGLEATSKGEFFSTPSSNTNEYLRLYRHDGEEATLVDALRYAPNDITRSQDIDWGGHHNFLRVPRVEGDLLNEWVEGVVDDRLGEADGEPGTAPRTHQDVTWTGRHDFTKMPRVNGTPLSDHMGTVTPDQDVVWTGRHSFQRIPVVGGTPITDLMGDGQGLDPDADMVWGGSHQFERVPSIQGQPLDNWVKEKADSFLGIDAPYNWQGPHNFAVEPTVDWKPISEVFQDMVEQGKRIKGEIEALYGGADALQSAVKDAKAIRQSIFDLYGDAQALADAVEDAENAQAAVEALYGDATALASAVEDAETARDQVLDLFEDIDAVEQARDEAQASAAAAEASAMDARYWAEAAREYMVEGGGRVVYVSTSGRDDWIGTSPARPVYTIKRALEIAGKMRDRGGKLVYVYPGSYYEDGNLIVPENTGVVSVGGQFITDIIITEGNETNNMFLVNSGSYIQGFTFREQEVDDFDDPNGGFAVAFAPGANIYRSPYIRDISQVSGYRNERYAAPLDPVNGNPAVGNGGGVLLADRAVLDQNSLFPYMLAFGATPRAPNGLGYVAKNGAGINGISSISIFQRCAFYALDGGQITLNNSGTQFGDISMRSKGTMLVVRPRNAPAEMTPSPHLADIIERRREEVIDSMWNALVRGCNEACGEEVDWYKGASLKVEARRALFPLHSSSSAAETIRAEADELVDAMWLDLLDANPDFEHQTDWSEVEDFVRRDAHWFLTSLARDFQHGNFKTGWAFVRGLFTEEAYYVFDPRMLEGFLHTWRFLEDQLADLLSDEDSEQMHAWVDAVAKSVEDPAGLVVFRRVMPARADDELLHVSAAARDAIEDNASQAVDEMWTDLVNEVTDVDWSKGQLEYHTRRDAAWLLSALARDFHHGIDWTTASFAEGLFDRDGDPVFRAELLDGFKHAWGFLRTRLKDWITDSDDQAMLDALFDLLIDTVTNPDTDAGRTVDPHEPKLTVTVNEAAATTIEEQRESVVGGMWDQLVANANDYTGDDIDWSDSEIETLTKRDAEWLLTALALDLRMGRDEMTRSFAEGLFDEDGQPVFRPELRAAFLYSWGVIESLLEQEISNDTVRRSIRGLLRSLTRSVAYPAQRLRSRPVRRKEPDAPIVQDTAAAEQVLEHLDEVLDEVAEAMRRHANAICAVDLDWSEGGELDALTRRDAKWLLLSLRRDLLHGNAKTTWAFAEGLYKRNGKPVFRRELLPAFLYSYEIMERALFEHITDTDVRQTITALLGVVARTLSDPDYGIGDLERFTRRDANDVLIAWAKDLRYGSDTTTKAFAQGLFDYRAQYVFDPKLLCGFNYAWERMRERLLHFFPDHEDRVKLNALHFVIYDTINNPRRIRFGSLIESLGHQFNNAGAGVNKQGLPLNFRRPGENRTVPYTISREGGGRVRWSGSDEFNNQYFANGVRINGTTGRFEGRPFIATVRQIARRMSNSRG